MQGNADNLPNLIENNDDDTNPCWTCPLQVKVGDWMLIYLMKPISSIVGHAFFTSEPFRFDDETSDWHGHRMATFEKVTVFDESEFISLKKLKELFPNWHWTTRPQGAIKVPEQLKPSILLMLL